MILEEIIEMLELIKIHASEKPVLDGIDRLIKYIKKSYGEELLKEHFNDEDVKTLMYLLSLDDAHQGQVLMFNEPAQVLWDKFQKLEGSKLDPQSSNNTE